MTKFVHVEDYYSGSGYWDTAFAAAFAAADWVTVGSGRFYVANPIVIASTQRLQGAGSVVTEIVSVTANQPVIELPTSSTNIRLSGFRVAHMDPARLAGSPPIDPYTGRTELGPFGFATAGGSGIRNAITCDGMLFEDIDAAYNYVGYDLAQVGYGLIENCNAGFNASHGFLFAITQPGTLQWYVRGCGSSKNGGDGYRYQCSGTNPNGTSVGQMTSCVTWSNSGNGLSFLGASTAPLHSARIEGGFIGQDGGHGIYLDTYGTKHFVSPAFVELAEACGIYVSYNNRDTVIRTQIVYNNGLDGIFNWGEATQIQGGVVNCNGRLGTAGRRNGIYLYELPGDSRGSVVIGVRSTDEAGDPNVGLPTMNGFPSGQQLFGIIAGPGAQLVGNDVRNNSVGGINGTPNASSGLNRT